MSSHEDSRELQKKLKLTESINFGLKLIEEEDDDDIPEALVFALLQLLLKEELSSDEEEDTAIPTWGGLHLGKAPNKNCDFQKAHETEYFSGEDSEYNESDFERHFRMYHSVFM